MSMCCSIKVKFVGGKWLGGSMNTTPGDVWERQFIPLRTHCVIKLCICSWLGGKWYLIILISPILSEVEHHFACIRAVAFSLLKIMCSFHFSLVWVLFLTDF